MSNLIIKNGRVVDPANNIDGEFTVVIEGGKIKEIAGKKKTVKNSSGTRSIDAKGAVVAPGFVDIHTHLREPGFEYKEDIESGSRAAVAGGFTSICCMPNTDPANDNVSVTEKILKRAKEVFLAKIYPVGAITRGLQGAGLADIGDMANAGIVAISDDGKPVMNTLLLRRAAEYAASFDLPVMDHCEDLYLSGKGVMNEGIASTELGLMGMPSAAEEVQVARDIALAKFTGAHFHITHISTAMSLELIRQAKKQKVSVTCDVTPHHLLLTEDSVRGYDTNTKVNPPLRTEADTKALVKGLLDGTVDAVATDHAPHGTIDKESGFDTAAFGISGLETALPVMLKLVHDKKLSLKKMIELMTIGLAKLNKRFAYHGFKKGAPADITIFDPEQKVVVDPSRFYSKGKNTPFKGEKLKGAVLYTVVEGRVVFGPDNRSF